MAVFGLLRTAWDIIATIALFGAVSLSLWALWVITKWWDEWRFRDVDRPSEGGKFIAGEDRTEKGDEPQ